MPNDLICRCLSGQCHSRKHEDCWCPNVCECECHVPDEWIDRIFAVMALCPQHTFQILTKRPERMLKWFAKPSGFRFTWREGFIQNAAYKIRPEAHFAVNEWPLPNLWLGVSVENQKTADERIPLLLQTPAAVRFISAEPLLGPVTMPRRVFIGGHGVHGDFPIGHRSFVPGGEHIAFSNLRGALAVRAQDGSLLGIKPDEFVDRGTGLDWVICGGESGSGARPMHPDWARSLRDQCVAAGVPFFFKQWGEWLPAMSDGPMTESGQTINCSDEPQRVGKKAAGALLDGREWREFPDLAVRA